MSGCSSEFLSQENKSVINSAINFTVFVVIEYGGVYDIMLRFSNVKIMIFFEMS